MSLHLKRKFLLSNKFLANTKGKYLGLWLKDTEPSEASQTM